MKHIVWIVLAALLLGACGQSYEEKKRLSRAERLQRWREDSAALKIAVMPTLDCLPLYVAKSYGLYDSLGSDIRLKPFTAQMDCDSALVGGSVEGAVSDLVRTQWMERRGTKIVYLTQTNAYWQLVSNRNARINTIKQLKEKMVAMTRYSATDLLCDYAVDSAKLPCEYVFKVQINDVGVRLDMLRNNEMDAMLLTEPQAAAARQMNNKVLMDTRQMDMRFGVIALRADATTDKNRKRQIETLKKAYNMACDSIKKYGVGHYRELIADYCKVGGKVVDALDKNITFSHVTPPRQRDIDRANAWIEKNK